MKTILITGTSSGIGRETALLFHKMGWNVAASMRSPGNETTLKNIDNVRCYRIDVTDRDSIATGIHNVIKDFGGIDVLVNNAGIYATNPIEMISDESIRNIIDTNIIGTINMTKMILPVFRKQKSGMIVNISSIAGKATFPYQTIYHGTKWAIEGISESLAYELKDINIRIKVVEPGMVKTNLYETVKNISPDNYPSDYAKSFGNWHRFLMTSFAKGYDPCRDAKTIYTAVTDNKSKLRYTTDSDTRMLLFLKSILPLSVFSHLIRKASKIDNEI
ncbi:MAG TPA: SDR family oxidoreductase [Spirochaetota bacterium]